MGVRFHILPCPPARRFASDNGGPSFSAVHDANNWPLRGSKLSSWEGGLRVPAFVAGGLVPRARRGRKLAAVTHIADWYATFVQGVASLDLEDVRATAAGLPPIDSRNLLPLLLGGANATARGAARGGGGGGGGGDGDGDDVSPHVALWLDRNVLLDARRGFKLFATALPSTPQAPTQFGCWSGRAFPNASDPACGAPPPACDTASGCLFNVFDDPAERTDLAALGGPPYDAIAARMRAELDALSARDFFDPDRGANDDAACAQLVANGGYYGPWLP